MFTGAIKKGILKKILNLSLDASEENVIKVLEVSDKFLVRDKEVKGLVNAIKEAFEEKSPYVQLVRNTFKRISPKCREKILNNFFINAGIIGRQKQEELKKKLGYGLPWCFVISPTARCNLSCRGCYAHEYAKHEGLSFAEVDRILKEAKELGIYFITMSGGESYLWPHLLSIFKKHNDMYFLTYTNGTLIDKKLAKKLAELGNVAPGISIEGFEKETDARRGAGIFKRVMQAMDNLREAGVLFGFSATLTKLNSEILTSDKFIDMIISKGCSFGWYFHYVPIGKKPDVSLMSTPKQRNAARVRINEIRKTKPVFIGDFWNDGPWVGGCIAGARPRGYFHINCNGDVEPCVFLQFSVDNIKGKKLVDVIQSPFFRALQREQPYCKNKNLLAPCALIDNPEVLRKIVKECKAKPSYNSSEAVVSDHEITKFLDNYSKEFKKITDPVWEKEMRGKYKHWKDYCS